jgi:hypothetical protein
MDLSDKDIRIDNSRPPLRWIANLFGSISCWAILRLAYLDEDENFGFRYKVFSFIHNLTWPLYHKYGTFYTWLGDLGGKGWDDYDKNGHPYWLYTEWQEDPVTGDAWRLVNKGDK